jgi:hypothetical protein
MPSDDKSSLCLWQGELKRNSQNHHLGNFLDTTNIIVLIGYLKQLLFLIDWNIS